MDRLRSLVTCLSEVRGVFNFEICYICCCLILILALLFILICALYISLPFGDRLCLFTVKTNVSYAEAQEPSSHPSSSSFFFFFFSFSVRWASYSIIYKTPGKVPSFVTFLLFAFFFLSLNCRLIWSLFFIILTVESSNTPGGDT